MMLRHFSCFFCCLPQNLIVFWLQSRAKREIALKTPVQERQTEKATTNKFSLKRPHGALVRHAPAASHGSKQEVGPR